MSGLISFINFLSLYLPKKDLLPKFLIVIVDMFELKFLAIDPLHTRIVSTLFMFVRSSLTCCSIPAKELLSTK